jgi:radical SAM protein with 4Fe4S-binding SPASM domain
MNAFEKNNIFQLPLSEEYGRDDVFLVYAPVAGNMMIASDEECNHLKYLIDHPSEASEDMVDIIESLIVGDPVGERDSKVRRVEDFLRMYVLPNYICNFACSYCFSAKGRSKKTLKKAHLKSALDFFIDSKRVNSDLLSISYLGGGEPTMSWDVVKFGIEYAASRACQQGIEMMTTIVTNGSLINKDMVDTFRRYNVRPRISFEILENIQNKQRGQYDNVCCGIDLLCEGGVTVMVRSMITPDNVLLMSQMIQQLHDRFPKIKMVLFDPIISNVTFSNPEFTRSFYDSYFHHFLEARQLAGQYGMTLGCTPLRNLDMVVERFCTGEFCLTPEGTITICHQVSSPLEKSYDDYVYARVDEVGNLCVDKVKFGCLIEQNTIYSQPRCRNCFVKWNCGGGCMMQNNQYSDDVLDVICDFTRRFSKHLLLERLAKSYAEDGESLIESVKRY